MATTLRDTLKGILGTAWHVAHDAFFTALTPAADGTVEANKFIAPDSNKDVTGIRHLTVTGNLVSGSTTITETEIGYLDGLTIGTVSASKALVVDTNSAISGLGTLTMADAKNIVVDTTTGTKFGTAVSQKIGFWNATPIVQPVGAGQASGASTTITSVGSTSLTALDVTRINAAFARIEEVRALTDAIRTALVNSGQIKGAA